MNSFQTMTRKEISMLQDRMAYIEQLVEKISKAVDRSANIYPPLYRPPQPVPEEIGTLGRTESVKGKKAEDLWPKLLEYVKV